jgi:N-terminal acetyltransferase 2
VTTNAQKLIPQSWKDRWHSYRTALKEAEKESLGDNDISEHVEMAGWGVEEAQARHKAEASKSFSIRASVFSISFRSSHAIASCG